MKLKNVSLANILLNVEVKKNKKTTVESQYLPAGGEVVELPDYFMCDYLKFLISEGRVIKPVVLFLMQIIEEAAVSHEIRKTAVEYHILHPVGHYCRVDMLIAHIAERADPYERPLSKRGCILTVAG